MALRHHTLDVLRIVVAAANDDQVLETAGNEQFAVAQEPEISGAQKRALASGERCGERFTRQRFAAPVLTCDVRTAQPDFTDHVVRTWPAAPRIDDDQFLAAHRS